eukprot:4488771-Pleurochrysis_carterae.AAC.2
MLMSLTSLARTRSDFQLCARMPRRNVRPRPVAYASLCLSLARYRLIVLASHILQPVPIYVSFQLRPFTFPCAASFFD